MEKRARELMPPDPSLNFSDLDEAYQTYQIAQAGGTDSERLMAAERVDAITRSLQKEGAIPESISEEIAHKIDRAYPNTKNKQWVTYGGTQFQLRFIYVGQNTETGKNIWERRWVDRTNSTIPEDQLYDREKRAVGTELFPPDSSETLESLARLREQLTSMNTELERIHASDSVSSLEKADRYAKHVSYTRTQIHRAETSLKKRGLLPITPEEEVWFALDKKAGGLSHGAVVEHGGKQYRLQFTPTSVSNSGKTVHAWERVWVELQANTQSSEKEQIDS